MSNVIVAFSKREDAVNIRNILTRSGVGVSAVCLTGAKVLQHSDMQYMQLWELLPDGYEILLLAPSGKWIGELPEGVVGLPLPLKVQDLTDTLRMMCRAQEDIRKKRKSAVHRRSGIERREIERAKGLLMERNGMSEEEAHRYLQKTSMESGTNMTETAQMVLRMMDV